MIDAAGFYNDDGIDYLHKRPDELLVSINCRQLMAGAPRIRKLRRRGAFDFPVLGVAAYIKQEHGLVSDARLVSAASLPRQLKSKRLRQHS